VTERGESTLFHQFLGRRSYRPTWDLQNQLADKLRAGGPEAQETLLSVEHDPVITIGRRGKRSDILMNEAALAARDVEVAQVDRGGEVTYHGPGQLVLYPIVRVDPRRFGVGDLVRGLAGSIAGALDALGIDSRYDPESPGLWVSQAKICAVGMRVSGGVSTHGAAVNVTTDTDAFGMIVPCGHPGALVTNIAREIAEFTPPPTLEELAREVADRFADHFNFRLKNSLLATPV
jgi:lipoate-protein ligase B